MRFFKGDIVCMDFEPARGHEQRKRRYAVVISNDQFNTRLHEEASLTRLLVHGEL